MAGSSGKLDPPHESEILFPSETPHPDLVPERPRKDPEPGVSPRRKDKEEEKSHMRPAVKN